MFKGDISDGALRVIAEKLLYNKVIQHISGRAPLITRQSARVPAELNYSFKLITVELS